MRMQSKRTTEESTDRGVSPVIGVILMVAITVILAAVIAAFVLDIGPGDTDPNAAISHDQDGDDLELELQSLDGSADAVVVVEEDGDNFLSYDNGGDENTALTVSGEQQSYDSDDVGGGTIQAISVDDPDDLNSDDINSLDDVENNAILVNLDDA